MAGGFTIVRMLAFLLLMGINSPSFGESRTVRILTVGNSFAFNATNDLVALAESAGHHVVLGSANFTGCSLERHWQAVLAAEAGDPAGTIYPPREPFGPGRSLRDFLESDRWDVVTLQQASRLSDDAATYQPFAGLLRDFIKLHAPQAEVVLHQTWAYRCDDAKFSKGSSPAEMHRAVRLACHNAASRLGLRLIPVGEAFHLASLRPEWTYVPDPSFDPSSIRFPQAPAQPRSLHMGWSWIKKADGTWSFWRDSTHANAFGKYLGSCVFFGFLFDQNPVGNTFIPAEITPAQALVLQEIAQESLEESRSQFSQSGSPQTADPAIN